MIHTRLLASIVLLAALCACHGKDRTEEPEAPSPGPLPAAAPPSAAAQAPARPAASAVPSCRSGERPAATSISVEPATPSPRAARPSWGRTFTVVFGRQVASEPGYNYSAALSAKDWTWDAAHLDGWLKSPRTYVPGTKMTFYGIPDDQDRRDLIAYLKVASSGGPI